MRKRLIRTDPDQRGGWLIVSSGIRRKSKALKAPARHRSQIMAPVWRPRPWGMLGGMDHGEALEDARRAHSPSRRRRDGGEIQSINRSSSARWEPTGRKAACPAGTRPPRAGPALSAVRERRRFGLG